VKRIKASEYEVPTLEIVYLEEKDIVTSSGGGYVGSLGDGGPLYDDGGWT